MPYTTNTLPTAIKRLPDHAQEIYMDAFNSAFEQYKGDEGRCNATAWSAVKTKYRKSGEKWVPKAEGEKTKEAIKRPIGKDMVEVFCPECKGDKFEPEGTSLRCCSCGTLTEAKKTQVEIDPGSPANRTVVFDYIPLTEATAISKGKASVVVLRPGFNSSKQRYYAHDTITRDFKVFEGAKMYADHPTEADEKARPERSIKDWVATLKNVRVNSKNEVVGEAMIVEPWLQEKLATLRDQGLLSEMGISINAIGQASKQTIEGTQTNFIEKIIRARSVDFVTEAGAGGQVEIFESSNDFDVDIISLEILKERRPDLVELIEDSAVDKIKSEVKTMELEEQITTLQGEKGTLLKENEDLKNLITEAGKKEIVDKVQITVKEALDKTTLPEPARARVTERFLGKDKADGLEEAIKSEVDYIATITEAGKVKGMGGGGPDPKASKEAMVESVKRLNPSWTDKQVQTFIDGR